MKRYKVVIVEPSRMIADGLGLMLSEGEFEVVGVYNNFQKLLEEFSSLAVDAVVIGSQVVYSLKQANMRFV